MVWLSEIVGHTNVIHSIEPPTRVEKLYNRTSHIWKNSKVFRCVCAPLPKQKVDIGNGVMCVLTSPDTMSGVMDANEGLVVW